MKNHTWKNNKGFSLVELMVSVSIFAVVMTIGVGSILAVVDGNRKTQTLQVAMNNLNYAIENMTRNMKTGQGFDQTDPACTGNDNDVSFVTTDNIPVTYSRAVVNGKGRLAYTYTKAFSTQTEYVTAPEIDIQRLCFNVIRNDGVTQPAVVMVISGIALGKGTTQSEFSLHTSVTQRAVQY